MFAACPTSSAKDEDCRPAVFMSEWSVGSTDLPHLISTINGDRKELTTKSLMIDITVTGSHSTTSFGSSICGPTVTLKIRKTINNPRAREMKYLRVSSEASITARLPRIPHWQ